MTDQLQPVRLTAPTAAEPRPSVQVYTTCPSSAGSSAGTHARQLIDVARWSEEHGCVGLLAYTDNLHIDPWLVAQTIIEHTERVVPLVAVQPAYLHPYTAAKMVASIGHLHGRAVHLNMVTGGSVPHLHSLGDHTEHDDRYERLVEYTTIVRQLLTIARPVTLHGKYHRVERINLSHRLDPVPAPRFFVSGASPAAISAAAELDVTRFTQPLPADEFEARNAPLPTRTGIRVGVIARPDGAEAWRVALARFPGDPMGEQIQQMITQTSDSQWRTELSALATRLAGENDRAGHTPYWLFPFRHSQTFCPYLVGSYREVADYLGRYLRAGVRTIILDVPQNADDLGHAMTALAMVATPAPAA